MSVFCSFKTDILLFAICACLSYLFLKYLQDRRRLNQYCNRIKGPLALPIIGSAYVLFGNTQSLVKSLLRLNARYGRVFKVWIGSRLTFLVSDPDTARVILNTVLDKEESYEFLNPVFGRGLLTLPVVEWRNHRKLISVTFNQRILNSFVRIFANYSNILVEKLEGALGSGYVDVFPILTQCAVDMISDTTMGVKLDTMKKDGHDFIPWTRRLSELVVLRMSNPLIQNDFIWKLTSKAREMEILSDKVQHYIGQIISMRRAERSLQMQGRKQDASQKSIFLDHLLELEEGESVWSQQDSIQETQAIMVAGCDSTALITGYALMMLGMHQDIQTRTYEEVISVLGENGDVDVQDLPKLCYLERVIKETLRLFPLAAAFGRQLYKDAVLENYTLPKGSSVFILAIALHRDPILWPEPLRFDPDRFLAEEVAKRHPYSYIPFSAGPRNCIGSRYAMMAVKTVLATTLRSYGVVGTENKSVKDVKLRLDASTKCVGGQKVQFERRM